MTTITALHSAISKLQFHYWFSDKSHTMDALVHNKCERELLELTKVVAKWCGVSVMMETEPSAKGGLKSWLTLLPKSPRKTPASKIAQVNILVAAALATPHPGAAKEVIGQLLDSALAHSSEDSQHEDRVAEIEKVKSEWGEIFSTIEQDALVRKRRSNFYDLLRKYQKVKSFSVTLTDATRKVLAQELPVMRDGFKSFLISSNTVAPEIIEHAQIEIISPVLVKGRHKWRGAFQDKELSFIMKSDDFMSMVQSGKVEFKSGSTISCTLEIERKINSAGAERITGYNILSVNSYSENGKTIETAEYKQKVKQTTASKRQLDLFG